MRFCLDNGPFFCPFMSYQQTLSLIGKLCWRKRTPLHVETEGKDKFALKKEFPIS